jgi:MoaA/NifB/PqqE/SkfB family radical SAM enzyme
MMATVQIPKPGWNETGREYQLRRDAAVLRGPVEWSWDVTNQCVGACLHCFNRSGILPRQELTDAEMIDLAGQIAAMKPLGVCFCGGEPLLRAGLLPTLARELTAAGTTVNAVSNGMLMTPSIAARLFEAGIRLVQVSVDGAQARTHEHLRRVPGSFDKAIAAIRMLRECGATVGVSFSPTRVNIHEWIEVYGLCRELGVADLRIQPLMPLGTCGLWYDDIAPSQAQYRELIDQYKRLGMASPAPPRLEWGDPVDHLIRFGQSYAMITYTVHVTSDGYLMPSVYLPVVLGNVRRHPLADYWRAGLATAWDVRLVREMAYRVRSNRDFQHIRPHPYFDPPVDLDLVDHTPAEIERLTDVTLDFIERVSPSTGRPGIELNAVSAP